MQNLFHPLQASLQQSYVGLTLTCPLHYFFLQWPSFSTVSGGEKHHPIGLATWRIHCDTRAGHQTGPAPHVYLLVKDLASRRVHRSTSSSVCGEGSCCVRVQLCANSVCFKHICQTGLFSRLWWSKSACLSVSNRTEFMWEVLHPAV